MNQNMPPSRPHVAPGQPFQPPPGQRQEYHTYQHPMPQSPLPYPYAAYPQYYMPPPPGPSPHGHGPLPHHYAAAPRWQPQYNHPPYMMQPPPQMPPQHIQYQPRSPIVVSSSNFAPPASRPAPVLPPQHMIHPVSQSPRPIPQHVAPPHVHLPVAPPSPASPIPKQEPPQEQEQAREEAQAPPPQQEATPPASRRQSIAMNPLSLQPEHKMPYYPKLPWYSAQGGSASFPRRSAVRRRSRKNLGDLIAVSLPPPPRGVVEEETFEEQMDAPTSEVSTIAAPSEQETPATSQAPSESDCTQVSPPMPSQAAVTSPKGPPTQAQAQHGRRDTRTAIAIPNIPVLSKAKPSPSAVEKLQESGISQSEKSPAVTDEQKSEKADTVSAAGDESTVVSLPVKPAPKSWAELVRRNAPASTGVPNGGAVVNGASLPKSASLADALKRYSVQSDTRLSYLEPKGLVNTGNMCYMNSILQVLVFCTPFYNFLSQVRQRTVHSLHSTTPLLDAMIMFMSEFKVLASADSVEMLRTSLSQSQLEQYGDTITPQYVYDAIAKLDRFSSMRRGHQQDAEEFLGFLLEGLHDECVTVMQGRAEDKPEENEVTSPTAVKSPTSTDGWLEVGPKQRASTTRTAGQEDTPSPVTKIFGGFLRSVFRVPGLKDSVTLELYKPLQLDIGASHINNITDALKGLTHTEVMPGNFGGKANSAKKQVFIDSLPPVLILHLKRFQYEHTGTQKIWKKVGYPLELEIPKEVFQPGSRAGIAAKAGLPKYRLISVVYHHGKSAAGGHYTVDVLREDYREWVRMDDTVIRRVRPEDVAEGGSEEDPKLLAKALEQHKADQEMQRQRNMYQGLDEADQEPEEEKPWSEVNGHTPGHRKWSSVANANVNTNGTATPVSGGKKTPTARKEGVRDNKVAYILLYERIRV